MRPFPPEELRALTGADGGSIGPIGIEGFIIVADTRLENANNLISGANKNDYHIANIDLQRDAKIRSYVDLRMVQSGEACTKCNSPLRIVNAIELGHVFKLGTRYAEALDATFLDEHGREKPVIMGSYGIGLERLIACHIEQHHDHHGIMWSKSVAPYHLHLILVNANNPDVVNVAEGLYERLQGELIDVLYDDRVDVSPGFKFKDADLLGMPLQIIVGEKNVVHGNVELKERRTGRRDIIELGKVLTVVEKFLES